MVKVRELDAVLGSTTENSMKNISETWPLLHKLAACTLLRTKENHPTLAKLYDAYREVCSRRNLKNESEEVFTDAVGTLEVRGVVRIQAASRKVALRERKVSLRVTKEELEFKLRDKTLINSILAD